MRFSVLGPLEVTDDHGVPVQLPAGRARTILALLCLHAGHVVPMDRLIDAAWDGAPPRSAGARLYSLVSDLRRSLPGSLIRTSGAGYRLDIADDATDLGAVRRLVALARSHRHQADLAEAASCLLEAVSMWRGRAFDGIACAELEREAERITHEQASLVEEYAELELTLGNHSLLVAQLDEWVARQPLREGLRAALMRALARSGRQAEAIAAYHDLRQRLAEELGVDPVPQLQDLYQAIVRGDRAELASAAPPSPEPGTGQAPQPAQLPADVSDFTGRAGILVRLAALLVPQRSGSPSPVIVISGPGGIGKSTLAVHAGHRAASAFPDGQLYANLSGTSGEPALARDVLARFLRDLGIAVEEIPADEAGRAGWYRSLLARRRLLLVLDDARDAAQVRPLLPGSASCVVVVTSRSKLTDLAGIVPLELGVLAPGEGRDLLERIVGRDRTAQEPAAAARVVQACAGLPLALRIASAKLAARPGWSLASTASRLELERSRLAELRTGELAVRASFQLSFDALPAPVARAFLLLGLTAPAVLECGAAAALLGTDETGAEYLLEVLVDASLLQSLDRGAYQLHDLLRLFAADLVLSLATPDEREQATVRLLTWYAATTRAASRALIPEGALPYFLTETAFGSVDVPGFGSDRSALTWFDRHAGALAWAVRTAAESGQHDIAIAIASLMLCSEHFPTFDGLAEAQRTGAASALVRHNRSGEQWLLSRLGIALSASGDYPAAIAAHEQALAISQRNQITMGIAAAHNNIGVCYHEDGRYSQALEYFRLAEVACRSQGSDFQLGLTIANVAEAQRELGDHEAAIAGYLEAIKLHQAAGERRTAADRMGEALARSGLGDTYRLTGCLADALVQHQLAVAIHRDLASSQRDLVTALDRLAETQVATGATQQARESWTEAISLSDRTAHPRAAAMRERLRALGLD